MVFGEYLGFWFLLRAFGTPVYTGWPLSPHGTPFRVGLLRFRAFGTISVHAMSIRLYDIHSESLCQ